MSKKLTGVAALPGGGPTSWKPGQSGNPGGAPKRYGRQFRECVDGEIIEHPTKGTIPAWQAIVLKAVEQAAKGDRHAREWLGNYLMGKAKESVEVSGGITPEAQAFLEALRLTPHERRLAQDSTAVEDDAAMDELVNADDHASE